MLEAGWGSGGEVVSGWKACRTGRGERATWIVNAGISLGKLSLDMVPVVW